jgi:hypothetical protein
MPKLYRVQDIEGRGPYRPGFSRFWSSSDGPVVLPWWEELGISLTEAMHLVPQGMFGGCAFASLKQLNAWFTRDEREKLDGFGFVIVRFRPDKIVAETPTQVVFAQSYPLAGLPVFGRLLQPLHHFSDKHTDALTPSVPGGGFVPFHDREVIQP